MKRFQCLGCLITETCGTDEDMQQSIKKAKGVYTQLWPIGNIQQERCLGFFKSI